MRRDEKLLLKEQLAQALAEADARPAMYEPMEIAILGGLLLRERAGEDTEDEEDADAVELLLSRARQHGEAARQAMGAVVSEAGVSGLIENLTSMDEEDEPEQRADALFELDEFFVGAWFCGFDAPELAEAADWTIRMIQGFPELFIDLSELATSILSRYPGIEPFPARMIWQAVESAAFVEEREPLSVPACSAARVALGLSILVKLDGVKALRVPRANADLLPAPPPWQTIDRGNGWELALTVDDTDEPILLFQSFHPELPLRVLRDSREIELQLAHEGVRTWRAAPGLYLLQIADEQRTVEVEP